MAASDASARIAIQRYFPLRVGYVWTYSERVVSGTQRLLLQRRVTLMVQSQYGHEYIAHWNFQSGTTALPNVRYRLTDAGVQLAQLSGDTRYTAFVYLLKAPLRLGHTWHGLQGARLRIAALQVACSVPAGTFPTCLETLQEASPSPTSTVHTQRRFAPDVGLVWQQRRLFINTTLNRVDTMELQRLPERAQL